MRDLIVRFLSKIRLYIPIVNLINKIKNRKKKRYVQKYGLEAIVKMDEAFSEMGCKMFPVFGTLLGAYRDHGFIPYDFDLDVGVINNSLPNDYHQKLNEKGFALLRQYYVQNNNLVLEETYCWKKVSVDLFIFFEEGNTYVTYGTRKHEYKDWKLANKEDGFPVACQIVDRCDFKRKDFLGHPIYMPEKTHEWLVDMYTDTYMTPIKNFDDSNKERRVIFPMEFRSYRRLIE